MSEANQPSAYRVLARKYRPSVFDDLVGQEILVRTLTHAFESGRIAHAFLLTGVRGIGKTTTARLIARALNCTAGDGPTMSPCGDCESCRTIAEDRHVDVLEMDAASRTGVDDMRGVIDSVRYAPVSARTKVYIIDEVHMLSKSAFNALLKTLEEPPPHVVFVFATTEVRKLPLTVLSRCQRFDLRLVEPAVLGAHLEKIAGKEGVEATAPALALLTRAAQGSVRDALSLLDQAIVSGDGEVTEAVVQEMLGLADRGRTLDLFEALLTGDIASALENLRHQFAYGADPLVVLQDLLELTHWLTRLKAVPGAADVDARTQAEQERGADIADKVPMSVLVRFWQMLLKGLGESQVAPDPITAVEMILVRLAYVADLPVPAEIAGKLTAVPASKVAVTPAPGAQADPPAGSGDGRIAVASGAQATVPQASQDAVPDSQPKSQASISPIVLSEFAELVHLAADRGEPRLHAELTNNVHLVRFEDGRIEIRPTEHAPRDLANRLSKKLAEWTGKSWAVVVSGEAGAPTLKQAADSAREERLSAAADDPGVRAVLRAFPGAEISEVRELPPNVTLLANAKDGDAGA